jgi:drug/metabolite transporter (DMT)-like permease
MGAHDRGESHPPSTSRSAGGYAVALLSAAILSTTAVLIRHLTQAYAVPALVLALWRDALAAITLLPILVMLRRDLLRIARRHLPYFMLYGLILAVFNAFWTLSVSLNGAAVSTVLAYSSAAFTALLGWRFLKESLHGAKVLAVVMCLLGCALVAGALDPRVWQSNVLGIMAGVLTGLAYAVYSLMGRSASQRGLNPWTILLYTFSFATLWLLLFNLLPADWLPGTASSPLAAVRPDIAAAGWWVLFLLAAGPTLLGFGLYNVSLSLLPSSVANLILTSEPAFTALLAYLLLGERLGAGQIIGTLLILTGVVVLRLYEGWLDTRERPASPRAVADRPPGGDPG